jgi:twitching motility protein PilT
MLAAYEFMYVTPSIQNLIRENKSYRIDSDIQTGKRYGMQLLDDNLWMNFNAGKISKEEAIDKSKNPGQMVARMEQQGLIAGDEALQAEAEEVEEDEEDEEEEEDEDETPKAKANSGMSEKERQQQAAANRARMQALQGKKP